MQLMLKKLSVKQMKMKKRKFEIPNQFPINGELIDSMAVYSLKYHYNCIIEEMDDFILHQKGHPDDYERNVKLKEHFGEVLKYWGAL